MLNRAAFGKERVILKRRGKAIAAWLGPTGDAARRAFHRVRGTSRTLDFYFDIGDPWSYLAAQAVERLVAAYPVELAVHVISPPASDVDPAPELRARHAVRDAQQLAEELSQRFLWRSQSYADVWLDGERIDGVESKRS